MSFAELRTVALANQFLEDPVPASSLVALLLEAVGSVSSTAVSFSTSLGPDDSLPSSIRTRNDASMILPGSHRQHCLTCLEHTLSSLNRAAAFAVAASLRVQQVQPCMWSSPEQQLCW